MASTFQTGNATSYTFTSHNIGTAAADRIVVVGVYSAVSALSPGSIGTVTIGGNNASLAVQITCTTPFTGTMTGLFYLLVISGTTATIVVPLNGGTASNCGISVWNVNGAKSTPFHTNSAADESTGVSFVETTLNIPDQGVGIANEYGINNNVAHTATGLTEDVDATGEGTSRYHGMSSQSMSAETARAIRSTGNASTFRTITAMSWEAAGGGIIRPQPTRFFPGRRFLRPEKKKLFVQPKLLLPAGYKRAA